MAVNDLLRRCVFRLLDRSARIDYFFLFLIGAWPVLLAWLINAHESHTVDGVTFYGYWVKTNFWPHMFLLPMTLWILRWAFGKIATISPEHIPENIPPILTLLKTEKDQAVVYQVMRNFLSSPKIILWTLGISLIIQTLDMSELVNVFLTDGPIRQGETDWSVMYIIGVMSKTQNIGLVCAAYLTQFVNILLQIFIVLFLLSHNLFFLTRIYQRSKVKAGTESQYIVIDLDDVNKCFGFRAANSAFNIQVLALIFFGLPILNSRFTSIYQGGEGIHLTQLMSWPLELPAISFFPDIGQILQALFWTLGLIIVSLPAVVKLIPRFSASNDSQSENSITNYLMEFLPDSHWPFDANPTTSQVNVIAAKFAENSFWPTGNNRASTLFFYAGCIFVAILYPIKTADTSLIILSLVVTVAIAFVFRTFMFLLIGMPLTYIDERLSKRRPALLESNDPVKSLRIDHNIFISYRREDSAAYARLIHDALSPHTEAAKIFMDRTAIHDGDDFIDKITGAVLECEALLVVIGPTWATCKNQGNEPRIMQTNDFVRLEIATGLASNRLVIPVLVGNASMPTAEQLPPELLPLLRKHARELSDSRWQYDTGQLLESLVEEVVPA